MKLRAVTFRLPKLQKCKLCGCATRWELEECPGSGTYKGSDQLPDTVCHACMQAVAMSGVFTSNHKRVRREA